MLYKLGLRHPSTSHVLPLLQIIIQPLSLPFHEDRHGIALHSVAGQEERLLAGLNRCWHLDVHLIERHKGRREAREPHRRRNSAERGRRDNVRKGERAARCGLAA